MMMFNPPHPGTVLRDYLGEMQVVAAAKHFLLALTTPEISVHMPHRCVQIAHLGEPFYDPIMIHEGVLKLTETHFGGHPCCVVSIS
jgi:hypothetical protein